MPNFFPEKFLHSGYFHSYGDNNACYDDLNDDDDSDDDDDDTISKPANEKLPSVP